MSVVAVMVRGLAHDGADTGSGCASDEASFKPSAQYRPENGPASASDSRAFAGANTTAPLIVTLVIPIVGVSRIGVLSPVAALSDAVIEVLVAVLAVSTTVATILILISMIAAAILIPYIARLRQHW